MPDSATHEPPPQLLRLPAVSRLVALGETTVRHMVRDGEFPRPVRVGKRAKAWIQSEVHAWIKARAEDRK